MASTGYPTPYAGLNQWVESDKVRMEDFNADNEKVDEALEQLATNKVDQSTFDAFAVVVEETFAERDGTVFTYSAQAVYEDGVLELFGLPIDLPEAFAVRFTAPADYLAGDLLRIGGCDLDLVTTGLHTPSTGTFAAGALVRVDVDLTAARAYLPGSSGGKRFEVFDLPPSRLTCQCEEIPDDVGGVLEIYAGQQFRTEKVLVVPGKVTFTPQWQTATQDIVIKKGQYHSPINNKVYVRTQ